MGSFMGGSPYAMAKDIVEGYILLTSAHLKRFSHQDIKQLKFELEKFQTQIRSEQPPQDDLQAIQFKNRKLLRITSALRLIEGVLGKKN